VSFRLGTPVRRPVAALGCCAKFHYSPAGFSAHSARGFCTRRDYDVGAGGDDPRSDRPHLNIVSCRGTGSSPAPCWRVPDCRAVLAVATGPTMLTRTFPQLLAAGPLEAHTGSVESWRFCVDTPLGEGREGALNDATLTRSPRSSMVDCDLLLRDRHRHRLALRAHPESSGLADDAYRRGGADRPHGRRGRHQRPYSTRGEVVHAIARNSSTVRQSVRVLNPRFGFRIAHRRDDEFRWFANARSPRLPNRGLRGGGSTQGARLRTPT
jgi:hypothetical protein